MCDSTGFFQLTTSAYQKVILTASCVGYSSAERQINTKKNNSIEITLVTNATLNGEVVVTTMGYTRGKITVGAYASIRKSRSYLQKVKNYFVSDPVTIFPNPAKAGSEIKIEWRKAGPGEYTIDLYNLQGQLIKSSLAKIENETNFFTFQVPVITPGSYILRLTNKKTGKKQAGKIIIQ